MHYLPIFVVYDCSFLKVVIKVGFLCFCFYHCNYVICLLLSAHSLKMTFIFAIPGSFLLHLGEDTQIHNFCSDFWFVWTSALTGCVGVVHFAFVDVLSVSNSVFTYVEVFSTSLACLSEICAFIIKSSSFHWGSANAFLLSFDETFLSFICILISLSTRVPNSQYLTSNLSSVTPIIYQLFLLLETFAKFCYLKIRISLFIKVSESVFFAVL